MTQSEISSHSRIHELSLKTCPQARTTSTTVFAHEPSQADGLCRYGPQRAVHPASLPQPPGKHFLGTFVPGTDVGLQKQQ